MRLKSYKNETANGLVVVVSVIATILAILGAAVSYTGHISRLSQRTRRTALAVEIADGHLEYLFTNWRNVYRTTWTTYGYASGGTDYSLLGTNYFCASCATCSATPAVTVPTPVPNMTPAATPPIIPLPAKSNFPTEANYTVTQYRIQAVDPMIDLDSSENAMVETSYGSGNFSAMPTGSPPPAAYGPNTWQYSFYYLAAADVSVPALGTNNGTVTAKVRRVFEKRFDNPWTYAMFYLDDLEFQPTGSFSLTGPVQTNSSLYIGTSNFTAAAQTNYGGAYVNGYSPNDTVHNGTPSAPNFPTNQPPAQSAPYLPFGWNVALNTSNSNPNDDSYHDIIEQPNGSYSDPLSNIRMYNQADYRILLDGNSNVTITDYNGTAIVNNGTTKNAYQAITGALAKDLAIQDNREGTYVRLTTLDVGAITTAVNNGTLSVNNNSNTGLVLFIKDSTTNGSGVSSKLQNGSSVTTTERAIRLKNGATLPSSGLTIVSENPVYIQGNYNTGSGTVPSNTGTYTDPDVTGYTRKPAAVYADAINILSNNWSDANSTLSTSNRPATNTTVNTALVTGEVPSGNGNYSGGGENFVRFLEDWTNKDFTYYGSMVELFNSATATGPWSGSGNQYKQPNLHWYYDDATFSNTSGPPGNLQIAAYLQQQRWYQVY